MRCIVKADANGISRSLGGQDMELAIYVRGFETQSQFYTMSGRWVHRESQFVLFSVPHFVQPQELDGLRPYLPASDVPSTMQNKLNNLSQLVPRSIGQSLIRKMSEFWAQSNAAYLAHTVRLDNAHKYVAYPERFRYATLDEITSILLAGSLAKTEDGKFPYHVLYAVHRSLMSGGIGFNSPRRGTLRAGGHYEINPSKEISNIEMVKNLVRKYTKDEFDSRSSPDATQPNRLQRFVAKARQRIDLSRETRQFTPYGTISSSIKSTDPNRLRLSHKKVEFDLIDMSIVRFLESWAAMRSVPHYSSLNGIGSAILRAVDRYDNEVDLDQKTAWTFLQEIGIFAPWENRAAYDMRMPDIGHQISAEPAGGSNGFIEDKLKNLRQDWGQLPVYCVDDASADEIDDGISVEATGSPDHYWVHIHTADPGARTDPKSDIARHAEELVESIYMPERVVNMLPSTFVQANLSLAPDRPCLTYSAKMNTNGDLLDYKVTPGIVRNVQYLSPSVFEETILGSASSKKKALRSVGPDIPLSTPRRMTESHELSDRHKEDLRLLYVVGQARVRQRKARGGASSSFKNYSLSVSLHGIQQVGSRKTGAAVSYHGDPSVQVVTEIVESASQLSPEAEFFNAIEPLMLLAGEIAAHWCSDRGIPVINRVTPRNEEIADPAEFFVRNLLPTMDEQGNVDPVQKAIYMSLLGPVQLSTTPGPHITIGVDMVSRCTSPLRRYPDLLLQWQVESAILEEARLGRSLVGNTRDDFLPFTKAQIDVLLPHIDTRERILSGGKRRARQHWLCLFILRAWKFGEAEIPSTFPLTVTGQDHIQGLFMGIVSDFRTIATCEYPDWISPEEIKIGDILEVELADINVYHSQLKFKPLRRLDSFESDSLERANISTVQWLDVR